MKNILRSMLLIGVLSFFAGVTSAQVTTGTPKFASIGGGPDQINLANLNVHLTIPVLHKPGRGLPFDYDITYDSSIWQPVGSSGSQTWEPTNVGGFGFSFSATGKAQVSYAVLLSYCYTQLPPPWGETLTGYVYGLYYAYIDAFGTPHGFPGQVDDYVGTCGDGSPDYSGSPGTATDGSGYTASVGSSTGNLTVTARNGQLVYWTADSNNNLTVPYETDTNGNQITTNSSNQFFDTLNSSTPVLTVSGAAPSPTTFTYTAPSGGGNVSYTMKYSSYTVKTNFGCSGIAEYGPTSQNLVSEIDLPDGSKYTLTYEPTPGYSGDYTGRLASVTLPTGGTISYSYSGGNNGIVCADGSTATLTRTTPDGAWTYAHSENGAAWTTNQTDPQGNLTVMNFQGIYPTEAQVNQGQSTTLQTTYTCYNGAAAPCNSTSITLPITQVTSLPQWANGQESKTNATYNSYGLVTEEDDYDYGSGGPGPLLRKTTTSYASLGNGIVDRPSQVVVYNGSGTAVAQTDYNYDQTNPVSSGITTQHVSVSGSRGNLTEVSQYLNTTNSWVYSSNTYFDTGMVNVAYDGKNNPTTYAYSSTYAGAYPTTITNALNQSTTYAYDANSGQVTSVTDPNNQATSYTYDSMMRPAGVSYPDGGQTTYSYSPQYTGWNVATTRKVDVAGGSQTSYAWFDGLGRNGREAFPSGEEPPWNEVGDTCYNSDGLVSFTAYSYQDGGWSGPPPCNQAGDSFAYDALGRATKVAHSDDSTITTSYSGPCATVTDEQGNTKEMCSDGLGRLTEVIENPGGLNYTTNYSYDALGNLTSIVQNGSHQRTFVYDSLSRLTSSTNPESGTTTYAYDANGNVTSRTGARGITTTYSYDALNRLTEKTYSDGTTPAHYYYDAMPSWWGGIPTSNAVGRLTAEGTSADLSTWPSAQWFSYDAMGRVVGEPQWDLSDGSIYWISAGRDLLGNVTSFSNGLSTTFTYQRNAAGEVTGVTSSLNDSQHPGTLAIVDPNIGYWPTGALRLFTLPNGLTEDTMYDARWRPCRINVNTWGGYLSACNQAASGSTLDLTIGPAANGNVTSLSAFGAQVFNRSYTYDAVNRLATMSAPGDACTGLSWTYDAWGNRTDQTATGGTCDTFQQSVNANNQFVSGYQYDAAGNITGDGVHTYTYDAEDRLTEVDGGSTASYVYGPDGQRVQKTTGGVTVQYLYDSNGHQIAEINSSGGWNRAEIYADNWHIGTYSGGPSGTTNFLISDNLGSTRLMTGYPSPTIADCDDYYPFGERISCGANGTTPFEFTGYQRDAETNLDNANVRYFASSLGRFMSPDPSGLSLQNPADPQSLNLYSYVRNSPLVGTDPTGMDDYCLGLGPPCVDLGDALLGGAPNEDPTLMYLPGGCASCLISQQPYTGYFGTDSIQAAADAAVGVNDLWNTININTDPWFISNGPGSVTYYVPDPKQPGQKTQIGPFPTPPSPPPQWVTDLNLFGNSSAPIPFKVGITLTKTFQACIKQVVKELQSGSPAAANGFGQCSIEGAVFQ